MSIKDTLAKSLGIGKDTIEKEEYVMDDDIRYGILGETGCVNMNEVHLWVINTKFEVEELKKDDIHLRRELRFMKTILKEFIDAI